MMMPALFDEFCWPIPPRCNEQSDDATNDPEAPDHD
jgi:hypothetical protein